MKRLKTHILRLATSHIITDIAKGLIYNIPTNGCLMNYLSFQKDTHTGLNQAEIFINIYDTKSFNGLLDKLIFKRLKHDFLIASVLFMCF